MLAAIEYRGDRHEVVSVPGVSLGYRWWGGRPGKSPGIHREGDDVVACAGTFAPAVDSPAAALRHRLVPGREGLDTLDGAFGAAWWDGARQRLTLIRDPFGVRSLYYTEHKGVFYFASELKQLLAIPSLPAEVDPAALHKDLTFSFVPGEDVPIRGIRRLLPGHVAGVCGWAARHQALLRAARRDRIPGWPTARPPRATFVPGAGRQSAGG